jgi:LPS sulfotransferase NodH
MRSRYWGVIRELRTYQRRCLSRAQAPTTKFLIFGLSRSGSTLLVTLLNSHPQIHCEDEILHHRLLFPLTFVTSRAALFDDQAYGFKLLAYQLRNVQRIRDQQAFLKELAARDFKLIYLGRRNLLRWALSNLYARHRAQFHHWRSVDGEPVTKRMRVDLAELGGWLSGGEQMEAYISGLLADLTYLRLVYEDHLEDRTQHQPTVDRVCHYLGLAPARVRTDLAKITPTDLPALVENYQEMVDFVSDAGYGRYLDLS